MTFDEFQQLASRPADALTNRDIEQLNHMQHIFEIYSDDPRDLDDYFRSHELIKAREQKPEYIDLEYLDGTSERVRIN